MGENANTFRVLPGVRPGLGDRVTRVGDDAGGGKDAAQERSADLNARLEELQELLYAEGRQKVLIVFQALDAGGKDGTIRRVFDGLNPQGVSVASFKAPTDEELAHDFLWRVHRHAPGAGHMTLFNRSHYEDVLVVKVEGLAPADTVERRYGHIAAFEQLLVDEGTTVLKFFLHISRAEQKERFQGRRDDPDRNWKFNPGDLDVRARWDDYMDAYEEAIGRTSTADAPWYVIPADRKWYRDLVISEILVDALEGLDMSYPPAPSGIDEIEIPD